MPWDHRLWTGLQLFVLTKPLSAQRVCDLVPVKAVPEEANGPRRLALADTLHFGNAEGERNLTRFASFHVGRFTLVAPPGAHAHSGEVTRWQRQFAESLGSAFYFSTALPHPELVHMTSGEGGAREQRVDEMTRLDSPLLGVTAIADEPQAMVDQLLGALATLLELESGELAETLRSGEAHFYRVVD